MGSCCCKFDTETNAVIEALFVPDSSFCQEGDCVTPDIFDIPTPDLCEQACEQIALVNCCVQQEDGTVDCIASSEVNASLCETMGGVITCPFGCGNANCEEFFDGIPGPCCLPDGKCEMLTQGQCNARNGEWRAGETDCNGVECAEIGGCRDIQDPYYNAGDKAHSLQLCETATMGLTIRQEHHPHYEEYPAAGRGFAELVTSHETRACRVLGVREDPCQHHFGALVMMPDGYIRPAIYSQPFPNEIAGGRWNLGVFADQVEIDPIGRVPQGYIHARVGVENEPWTELLYYSTKARCEGVS